MSIHSMTGFANVAGECGSKRINLELRAVNHRYLDVQFKMPDDLRQLESTLREAIAKNAVRGKIECRIQIQTIEAGASGSLNFNQELVKQLAKLNKKWLKKHNGLGKLTVADILKYPGVIASQNEDEEAFTQTIHTLLGQALIGFAAARRREGEKMQQHLLERLAEMEMILPPWKPVFQNCYKPT